MNNTRSYTTIVFMILMLVAVILGVTLIRQNADTRKSAFFATSTMSILPESGSVKTGEEIALSIFVNSSNSAKITQVESRVCANSATLISMREDAKAMVVPEVANGFEAEVERAVKSSDGKCLSFTVISNGTSNLKSGAVKVATVKFNAAAAGNANFSIDTLNTIVAGENGVNLDKAVAVNSFTGSNFTISQASVDSGTPRVKFKIVLSGVRENSVCAKDIKLDLTAVGANQRVNYQDVVINKVGNRSRGEAVYSLWEGEVTLAGFSSQKQAYLLIRGPKHVQTKYGVNNQSAYYNKEKGELEIKSGLNEFDFGNYHLLAGDVVGTAEGDNNPDGIVNGRDFVYVTNKLTTNDTKADLDYDCSMSTQDQNLVRLAISERQSQNY